MEDLSQHADGDTFKNLKVVGCRLYIHTESDCCVGLINIHMSSVCDSTFNIAISQQLQWQHYEGCVMTKQ